MTIEVKGRLLTLLSMEDGTYEILVDNDGEISHIVSKSVEGLFPLFASLERNSQVNFSV
ncbi:hypothetical protein ACHMW6_06125 [Pseudoduganella sp. UC29_106]|uniref:hypothetical protein n=1 Tax=Pseudoduganella sp. UC29_106 TaxID=3374553 RepID=UPI0037583F28